MTGTVHRLAGSETPPVRQGRDSSPVVAAFDLGYRTGHGDGTRELRLTGDARIGAFVQSIRLGLGLTLTAAAVRIGVSRQTLARVEQGERWLDPTLREQVIRAYGAAMAEGYAMTDLDNVLQHDQSEPV